jgi:hypothetical protein
MEALIGMLPENWQLIAAALVPLVASIIAALVPDGHWLMKGINFLAVNKGMASNDPSKQGKQT